MQEGVSPQTVKAQMAKEGVNVHISSQSSTRTDFERNNLPKEVIRASVHYYNTEDEVDTFIEVLRRIQESN